MESASASHVPLGQLAHTWMVLVEVCSVVVLTTRKTATTGMLPVLADSTVAGGNMASVLPRL